MSCLNRSFYSLLSSRSFANLAGSLYMMTLIAAVYQLTGSAAFAGAVSFVRSLAVLSSSFSLPFWYRKMTVAHVTRLFLFLQCAASALIAFSLTPLSSALPASAFLGYAFCGIMLIGYVEGCASAAANALYPRLVEENQRVQANSLVSTSMQMLSLLGWTMGGILVAKLGHSLVLQLSAGLLLLGCLFIVRLSHDEQGAHKEKGSRSMMAGWAFLFTHPRLRIITWMDIIEGIAGGIWIGGVTLVFAQEVLQKDEAWWGYINAAYYAGTIIGGLITLKLSALIHRHLVGTIIVGSFGVSLFAYGYAFNTQAFVALAIVLLMGPFYQLRDIAQRTYVQQYTPLAEQPNVFAAQSTISYVLFGVSVLFAGTVADMWGPQSVYIVGGTMYLLSAFTGFILKKKHAAALTQDNAPVSS
ncbi:MFS transporter [Paenibacillus apiarius]|uniref:MFS transporter n=1 Tax=Paenibacillus apiarius TaxID=46240 RepID=UPI00227DB910|nr:MFS transporter [Paenibacillus apiarius]MCY9514900.1 MFS transporter [Paenibacillus apiarius]MCY9551278.1 MFS transporter [Paenibacillus apiarius]MCY9558432.1 MFS transporter [Paenibacillus apiarius]MCY9721494.1 MFS transporter [Paenibacillus apiarius]MCY9793439.1 MFS transporter [Paenibacillus apiarius]